MFQQFKDPPLPAHIHEILSLDLLRIDHGDKEVGRVKQQCPAKLSRRYAQDGKRMLVQPNDAADNPQIALEMGAPIRVAEHYIWSAVRAVLVGGVKETAKARL